MTKAYLELRDVRFEWFGKIPSHWEIIAIKLLEGNSATVVQTGPFGAQLHASDYIDDGVPLILIKHVNNLKIATDDLPKISPEKAEQLSMYRLEKGDIVFSRVGSIGRIALVDEQQEGWLISGQMLRMRIRNPKVYHRFAIYAITAESSQSYFELTSVGSTRDSINTDILRNFPIPIPPLPEQKAIADFLDCKAAQIDTLIEKKQRQIDLLQEQRTALINQAVTKGLNPDVPMKDSGVEWLGEVPSHWEVKRLRRYEVLVQTGPFGSQLHSSDYVPNGFPVVNPANMVNGIIVPDESKQISSEKRQELSQHILQKGDIVFARRGELGRAVLVSEKEEGWLCGTGSILIRFFETRLRSDYLSYYLQLPSLRDYFLSESVGSTMDNLNSQILLGMPLLEPPSNEQAEIVEYVSNVREKARQAIENISKEIGLLQEYRTALISEAVTGKVDVRTQEPEKEYRGAVLIIGSLWWDNSEREQWRNTRLAKEQKILVFAPIRYGRKSLGEKRKNTYTMVFSSDCYSKEMGKALLVPFKNKIKNLDELIIEAKKLWKAEGGVENRISGTWGAVGLLVNSDSNFPTEIVDGWKSFYKGQEPEWKPDFKAIGNEAASLSDNGILMLQWIEDVENNKAVDFDFILATATLPNVGEYPTPEEIAQACLDNQYTDYFDKNQDHGITTFQDNEILKLIHSKK